MTIRTLEVSAVQVNRGMRISVMPGARRITMVAMKFIPVSVLPTPLINKAHSQ